MSNNPVKKYIKELSECALFANVNENDIISFTEIIGAHTKLCGNGEIIIHQDELLDKFGIVLSGTVTAVRYNTSGGSTVIAKHTASSVFGELLACHSAQPSPVNVVAESDTVIMFISYSELFKDHVLCSKPGVAVFKNLASLMSAQYFRLEKKLRYMSIPSLRDRIIEFLIDCASTNAASDYTFSVPFDREGMAQYLNVNRSALSRELSKMKKEHIIDYNKNSFRFLGDSFLGDF